MNTPLTLAVLFGVVCLEGAAAVEAWRWWRRRRFAPRTPPIWVVIAAALGELALFFLLMTAISSLHMSRAVAAQDDDVSQKARLLAEGISESMNAFAFAQVVVLPTSIVVLVRAWRQRRGFGRPEGPPSS